MKTWYLRRYGVKLERNQIMSVYGSQEGLTHIALSICDPGDIVLCPNPGYPIFEMGPSLCGAKIEHYELLPENGFLPDLDAIDPEVAKAAKMMVVSYPANPVCVAAPRAFYEKLVAFAKEYNIIIVHDNAYSEIIFDGHEGLSFLSVPGAMDVGVEFNSLSKTYNLTGARMSFVLGNEQVVQMYTKLRSQIDYGIFLPIQAAAVAALNGPQECVESSGWSIRPAVTLCAAASVPSAGTCRTARAVCSFGRLSPRSTRTPRSSALPCWKRPVCCVPPVLLSAPWVTVMCVLR